MSQFLTDPDEIKAWLKQMNIDNYTINRDGTVDCDNVVIADRNLDYIPVQFGKVKISFNCHGNRLKSLQGCPREIGDDLYCGANPFSSLEHLPSFIGGSMFCYENEITSRVLNLLLVRDLQSVMGLKQEVQNILNNHLETKDIFACQQDLINAGFEEYAQL